MASLEIRSLTAGYGNRPVLRGLRAAPLPEGTLTALLGPNGSGKSTLLKTLAGLNPMLDGDLRLDGADFAGLSPARRAEHAMYMPQALPKGVHMTVLESVLVAARSGRARQGGDALMREAMQVLAELGIGHLASRYLDELSGGQKQLASLAQALVRRPRLLLLDEPLSALDLNYQFHVMDVLRRQTVRHRLITLVVLHDLNIALRHADHALLLHGGVLLAEGPPRHVVTPDTLRQAYGVLARVERCPQGQPQVHVDGLAHHGQAAA
ncbi:Iron(3+)-hydroxamate import ATP-binding protein FhuC [Achromobacter insuavis]|uniref:ABC transporter ATP-binding protein n=1 Tax=Achromobacter insuavis TaxID=1287735 RepID=UPI001465924D|nr:ABC transporter ATP-binding protein [Achromobacter insuavis]CAB3887152.1 Iron(3+)-hydroxamate import ATP-binding protein FhuC [Achromobacter insuavis]